MDAGSWARTGSATDLTWNRLRCVASQTTGSVCWPAAGTSWTGWTVKRFGPPPDAAAASECSCWCWSLSGAGPLWKANRKSFQMLDFLFSGIVTSTLFYESADNGEKNLKCQKNWANCCCWNRGLWCIDLESVSWNWIQRVALYSKHLKAGQKVFAHTSHESFFNAKAHKTQSFQCFGPFFCHEGYFYTGLTQ